MYSYIIGTVTGYDKNCIILENNKIGYLINVANPYSFKMNEEIKVYLYNHIKEDENSGVKWVPIDKILETTSEAWVRDRVYTKIIEKMKKDKIIKN